MRKKPKPRNPKRNRVDLISDLPDPVIQHILSFLPSEEAAKTCILSKRWLNLCASVPVLDICIHRKRRRSRGGSGSWGSWTDELVKFMNGFLQHRDRNAGIEKFSFCIVHYKSFGSHLDNWINFSLENKLDFEDWDGYVAIEEALYDETLVERDYKRFDADWFTKLRCFIDHLHYAKVLKINCCDKALIFPKGLADTLPPPTNKFKNLEIKLTSSTKQCRRNLVKSLLLLCPSMETLSVNLVWTEDKTDVQHPNLLVNVHDHRQKLGFSPAYIRKQRLECQWPPSCIHQF